MRISPKAKLLIAAGIIVAGTSGVAAFNIMQPATAEVMSPTEVKVQEHDARLDKAEADIAKTEDRVSQVEEQTAENTGTINTVQERVTVVERQAAAPAARTAPVEAAPTPTPKPVNPRLIVDAIQTITYDGTGISSFSCTYTLESGAKFTSNQTGQCYQIGTDIPAKLAAAHGI